MHRPIRILQAAAVAMLLTAVPIASASACSCAMTELDQAVNEATVAFVGYPVSVEPAPRTEIGETVLTTWAVERSRDPIGADTIAVRSWVDSGANCGISFAADERWLVLAYESDGVLETNGCNQNRRLDGSDPEGEAAIASMLTVVPEAQPAAQDAVAIPTAVVALGAAALLVVAVSLLAFRRRPPG